MRDRVRLSPLLIAVLWAAPPAAAQPGLGATQRPEEFGASLRRFRREDAGRRERPAAPGRDGEDTVRVDTMLTVLDVAVTDAGGTRFITGLGKDDFLVTEDGVPQRVDALTLGDDARKLPRSIVLVIDWSGSLRPYLDESIKAAKRLVDRLAPTDEMAIVTDDVRLAADFTTDKKRLRATLDSLKKQAENGWKGKSLQFSALLATLTELVDVERRRPIVIFQTDGDEAQRLADPPHGGSTAAGAYYLSDVYAAAERSRVKIYTVIPGEDLAGLAPDELLERARRRIEKGQAVYEKIHRPADRRFAEIRVPDQVLYMTAERQARDHAAAARVAELTGGWTAFLESPEQADAIYGRILSDINHRYIISYYPTNREKDGRLRGVRVEVRGHPEYVVHGRRSYYAAPPD